MVGRNQSSATAALRPHNDPGHALRQSSFHGFAIPQAAAELAADVDRVENASDDRQVLGIP